MKNKKITKISIACIALIITVTLIACTPNVNKDSKDSKEITSYKESIENGKVEIDGISYDVQYISKNSYTYDDNENLLIVNFYDIEYNENLLPETITIHQVESKIAAEDIKDYQ